MPIRISVVLQFDVRLGSASLLALYPPAMGHDARPYEQSKVYDQDQAKEHVGCYFHAPEVIDQWITRLAPIVISVSARYKTIAKPK